MWEWNQTIENDKFVKFKKVKCSRFLRPLSLGNVLTLRCGWVGSPPGRRGVLEVDCLDNDERIESSREKFSPVAKKSEQEKYLESLNCS